VTDCAATNSAVPGAACGATYANHVPGSTFPVSWIDPSGGLASAAHFTPTETDTWTGVRITAANTTGVDWAFGATSYGGNGNPCATSDLVGSAISTNGYTGVPVAVTVDGVYLPDPFSGIIRRHDRRTLNLLNESSTAQFVYSGFVYGDELWLCSQSDQSLPGTILFHPGSIRIHNRFTLAPISSTGLDAALPNSAFRQLIYDEVSETAYLLCGNSELEPDGVILKIDVASRTIVGSITLPVPDSGIQKGVLVGKGPNADLWVSAIGWDTLDANNRAIPDSTKGRLYRVDTSTMELASSTQVPWAGNGDLVAPLDNDNWIYHKCNEYDTATPLPGQNYTYVESTIRRVNTSTGVLDSTVQATFTSISPGIAVNGAVIYAGSSDAIERFTTGTGVALTPLSMPASRTGTFFAMFKDGATVDAFVALDSTVLQVPPYTEIDPPATARMLPAASYPSGTWSVDDVVNEGPATSSLVADGATSTLTFTLDAPLTSGSGAWGVAVEAAPLTVGTSGVATVTCVEFLKLNTVTAVIAADPLSGYPALNVHFDGTGSTTSGDPITSYAWDFGDGETATGAVVDHTFGTAGARTVTLTVSTASSSDTATVVVNAIAAEVQTAHVPTADLLDTLRWSHRAYSRVVLRTPDCQDYLLPVVGGSVTIDRNAKTFRSADLDIAIDALGTDRRSAIEKLTVQSGEVLVYAGTTFEDNRNEEVLVGRMRVDSLERTDSAVAKVTAYDYSLMLDEHPVDPAMGSKIPKGTDWRVAIRRLIEDTFTWKPCGMSTMFVVDPAVPAWAIEDQAWDNVNRLSAIMEWAEARNCWFYNLPDGRFYLTPANEDTEPVWTVDTGEAGVLVRANQRYSREEQYNAVSISFDLPDPLNQQIRIIEIDEDPNSATRWGGPFGKRVLNLTNVPATSESDASAIAIRKLNENKGATRALTLTTVRNPALIPGQVITVVHPLIGTERHIIERVTHQLNGGTSDIDCKLRRS
jgi:PKD repeat protein